MPFSLHRLRLPPLALSAVKMRLPSASSRLRISILHSPPPKSFTQSKTLTLILSSLSIAQRKMIYTTSATENSILKALDEKDAAIKAEANAVQAAKALRTEMMELLRKRFSYEYNVNDFDSLGYEVMSNVLELWRQYFISGEEMIYAFQHEEYISCDVHQTFETFHHFFVTERRSLPFAVAKIGLRLTNEISPLEEHFGSWEFTLAMIEHFVDPEDKSHPKFVDVAELELTSSTIKEQLSGISTQKLVLGEAVSKGYIKNETLGYYMGRTLNFLTHLGIDKERVRFYQRMPYKTNHYTSDYWDAQIESSYGWLICARITSMSYKGLQYQSKLLIVPSKQELGLAFNRNQNMVVDALEAMSETEALEMKTALEDKGEVEFYICALGKAVTITQDMVSITITRTVITPSVIQVFFNIHRMLYTLYEHFFYTRPSKSAEVQLSVFRFPPLVAPVKCTVFPVVKNEELCAIAKEIGKSLEAERIVYFLDCTAKPIGTRYKRSDEIGAPFSVIVVKTVIVEKIMEVVYVSIRERESKKEIFINIDEVVPVLKALIYGQSIWADIVQQYKEQHPVKLFVRRSFLRRFVYCIVCCFCSSKHFDFQHL